MLEFITTLEWAKVNPMEPAATRQPTRTQRRAAEMRVKIVEAAERLVEENGPAALTTELVAVRADVSVQTVYNRVGGKPALLIAIAEKALEASREYMDVAFATAGTPAERVRRAAEAFARFALDNPHQFQILVNPPSEPEAMERVAHLLHVQNGKLAVALGEGVDDGTMDPRIEPATMATVLWAMMSGVLTATLRTDGLRPPDDQVNDMVAQAISVIERGLTVPS
jgi:AcrR family transcriptional regulator